MTYMKSTITTSRAQLIQKTLGDMPAYRVRQTEAALFHDGWNGWNDVTTLPADMRERLAAGVPWMSISAVHILESARHDTWKAVVAGADGKRVETVLMRNARGHWSICVSSQVGCPMACTFCATGTMGFIRNLTADEIVDQYRLWQQFLAGRPDLTGQITNIVFMGMGEPLANYDNVKETLRTILAQTPIGPTRITVSTVGLLPRLRHLLSDPDWPPVRLAVSLHSADNQTRKDIMPSSFDGFLDQLRDWAHDYFAAFPSRRRHVTFEYVMLGGVNDTAAHADKLAAFAHAVGNVRVNVIPYNMTGSPYKTSTEDAVGAFIARLEGSAVTVTRRRTMGDDIAAACGQLVVAKDMSDVETVTSA